MTEQTKTVAKKKRIDIHTATAHNGLLELQRAIQDGYVIDFSATPARSRANRLIVTLIGGEDEKINAEFVIEHQAKKESENQVDKQVDKQVVNAEVEVAQKTTAKKSTRKVAEVKVESDAK